ncbi:hypothetical protein [Nocardia sp. NPDC004260]
MPSAYYNEVAHEFTAVASRIVHTLSKATDDLAERSRIGPQLRCGVNELVDGDLRCSGGIERVASEATHPWVTRTPADIWREGSISERWESLGTHDSEPNVRREGENSSITCTEHSGAARPGNGGDRFEIPPSEAQELYEQVRDREPDFAGTGNGVHRVDTSAGPAVVRSKLDNPVVTFVKKWMPENTAIEYAQECDVRTPRILYAGSDPSTGREFTIMQYVSGETRPFNDPELLHWLPDLLDQVQSIAAHPVPPGMEIDIPEWQRRVIQHADDAYHNLPPERRAKLEEIGIGPLSEHVQPEYRDAAA